MKKTSTLSAFRALGRTLELTVILILPLLAGPQISARAEDRNTGEITVDAVLASVDGKPITLQEVRERLTPPRALSLREVSADLEARRALAELVMESLIEAEAETRKIKASDEDVNLYLKEVARRNQLTLEQFEAELLRQGFSMPGYRQRVRIDILRSKITSQLIHTTPAASIKEVEEYLAAHPELKKGGSKVKLRQIFLFARENDKEPAKQRLEEIKGRIAKGENFADLAGRFSQSAEATDGGLLGVVALEDLSPAAFDAVFPLKEGEVSAIVAGADGVRLFQAEKVYSQQDSDDAALLDEVRAELDKQKQQARVSNFFENELRKLHAVDQKI